MTRSSAPHAPARVQQALREVGAYLMQPYELTEHLNVAYNIWEQFGSHWEELCDDPYARELGTRRQRRYDHFVMRPGEGSVQRLHHDEFLQPEASNPLYLDRRRHFEPLTGVFAEDPVLHRLLQFLGGVA